MKRLLAFLLLCPIVFAKVDLHCVNLEKLPEGDYRNHLMTIDIPNRSVSYMAIHKNGKSIKGYERERYLDEVNIDEVEWDMFPVLQPFRNTYTLNRENLKLKLNAKKRSIYETTQYSQCEIIDNKYKMLKHYRNKVKESDEYYKKLREEEAKKNKI